MKIRRKLPKASPGQLPAYLVGYTGPAPSPAEVRTWFDLEYGGPLKWTEAGAHAVVAHTSWQALITLALPALEADAWRDRVGWDHAAAASIVMASSARPSQDLVLHGARLARGLTLLTQGTAFDVATGRHVNPSDWTDRRLDLFDPSDHVAVIEAEGPDARQWFFTRGLRRFGLDELEYFHPIGLTAAPIHAMLQLLAAELIVRHPQTNVGATLHIADPPLTVRIVHHRTVPVPDGTLIVREVQRVPG